MAVGASVGVGVGNSVSAASGAEVGVTCKGSSGVSVTCKSAPVSAVGEGKGEFIPPPAKKFV